MLRLLLGLALLVIAAGIGFFYGRHLHPVPSGDTAEFPRITEPARPEDQQTRSRQPEMGEAGPQVPPSAPISSPLGEPVAPPPAAASAIQSEGKLPSYAIGPPIAGLSPEDIHDTFNQPRDNGDRRHEASDIMAPRGTPVLAAVDGVVKKLFKSIPGGLTVYQFDSAEQYCFYYAHLDGYAEGLREGQLLRRGDRIGYVGTTGNSDPNHPHLHFAILELGPEKKWWEDTHAVNPYFLLLNAAKTQRSRR